VNLDELSGLPTLRRRVAALLLAAGVCCLVSNCTGSAGGGCLTAGDCASGSTCTLGACQPIPGCVRAADCDAGQTCLFATCELVGNACEDAGACAAGEICNLGTCEPPTCTTASDCAPQQACVAGSCEPAGTLPVQLPDGGLPSNPDGGGCQNLQCAQVTCADGGTTTLTGSVFDPSGQVALYNAIVYVPNGDVEPFAAGVTCDTCGSFTTGNPLVITLTDAHGSFTLQDVPAGVEFPLVLQIGKWRRQLRVPAVQACASVALTDVNQQRMPRSQSEGDLPQFAIATGAADPFECLLLKMGIDSSEFSLPTQAGRVHMYVTPESSSGTPPMQLPGGSPPASSLWSDAGNLQRYDVVLLPCEGGEYRKPDAGIDNLVGYTSSGGRLFVTHYSYVWTAFAEPFSSTANWVPDAAQAHNPPDPFAGLVDTSFPKGQAFSEWLGNVGALDGGMLLIVDARDDVGPVNLDAGTRWIYGPNPNNQTTPVTTQHLTFNTPVGAPSVAEDDAGVQCGRVVFSDFHVTAGDLNDNKGLFPASCKAGALTPQEKALIFMLFDVSSCVQSDQTAPTVCPGSGQSCSVTSPCCTGLACVDGTLSTCAPGEACSCQVRVN
jgi:hypothetical protein